MRARSSALLLSMSLFSVAMVAVGCESTDSHKFGSGGSQSDPLAEFAVEPRSMVPFAGCEEMLGFTRAQFQKKLEPIYKQRFSMGYPGGMNTGGSGMGTGGMGMGTGVTPDMADPAPGGGAPGEKDQTGGGSASPQAPDHSKTNNQTEGVDEPDLVKTDGKRLFTLRRGQLRIMDLQGAAAKITDTLVLSEKRYRVRSEMLIHGNRILVLLQESGSRPGHPEWREPQLHAIEIDASQSGQAKIVGRLVVSGSYISARKVDATVRLVLRTQTRGLDLRTPSSYWTEARQELFGTSFGALSSEDEAKVWDLAERKARAHNDTKLMNLRETQILPYYRLERGGVNVAQGSVYGCEHSLRPGLSSGVDMLSVLSLDLGESLTPLSGTGVMASGSEVYASASSLYVATRSRWDGGLFVGGVMLTPAAGPTALERSTYIHKFDISDPKQAAYRATGKVDGELLNQFAMSEHQGVLRVAATRYLDGRWEPTDSFVATLKEEGKHLVELGRAAGLGKTEMIRSVRFMGDVGYVVTFRRTDPLYTLDLKNPVAPTVLGELKIDGYSAYLHPLEPGYLLGVGRDADPMTGRVTGMQVSIFDVRDLKQPKRIHNYVLPDAQSRVDFEHRAFLYWPKTKSLVLPVEQWGVNAKEGFMGAMMFGVSPDSGIELRTRIRHPNGPFDLDEAHMSMVPIERSVVVGDALWTMSDNGVMASSVERGVQLSWLSYQ